MPLMLPVTVAAGLLHDAMASYCYADYACRADDD